MASPPTQSPERARLRQLIEARVVDLDITWAQLSETSGVPYETIRRIRTGNRPITRDIREALESGLGWALGSIREILKGGDPTVVGNPYAEGNSHPGGIVTHVLDTPAGRVTYVTTAAPDGEDDLTPEERAEIEELLAAQISASYTALIQSKRTRRDKDS